MNQQIKALWVDALRSGEYPQGKEWLHRNGFWCCLGVLCDIAGPEVVSSFFHKDTDSQSYGEELTGSILPHEVLKWAGLEGVVLAEFGGNVTINNVRSTLAWHNDDGHSFAEIADAIEKEL